MIARLLRTLLLVVGAAAVLAPGARAGEPKWLNEIEIAPAPGETLKKLLEDYAEAVKAKEAPRVQKALEAMLPHDNPELKEPAEEALRYKASGADKKAVYEEARQKGVTKADRIKSMLFFREERVQMVAAKLLGRYPDADTEKLLARVFMDRNLRDDKPNLVAAAVESMGRIGYTKLWGEIEGEFVKFKDREIMRAAVRYFGLTKERRVAKTLCDHVDEPQPANVNSGTNPPASYWKARGRPGTT